MHEESYSFPKAASTLATSCSFFHYTCPVAISCANNESTECLLKHSWALAKPITTTQAISNPCTTPAISYETRPTPPRKRIHLSSPALPTP